LLTFSLQIIDRWKEKVYIIIPKTDISKLYILLVAWNSDLDFGKFLIPSHLQGGSYIR